MKHEKISIKWRIFIFLLIFIVILLVILWLLQVCYLDSFYKYVRTKTAENVREEVIAVWNSSDEESVKEEQFNLLAAGNNLAIYIVDTNGQVVYNAEYVENSRLNQMPKQELDNYYQLAKDNGGCAKIVFRGNRNPMFQDQNMPQGGEDVLSTEAAFLQKPDDQDTPPEKKEFPQNVGNPASPKNGNTPPKEEVPLLMQSHQMERAENVIYVTILNDGETEHIFFLNSMLTPVNATVYTLKIELIFISIVMLILSILLALIISRQISKSMIRVNDSARELAKGKYDVVFEGKDYKEIAELSDTLNYMAKELERTEQFRRELIANVSHDLRTPLTMITAYSEAMRDLPGENTPENIQVVIDESMHLTNLVNDMLDLSKLQAGVLVNNSECYNLTEGIRLVLKRYNKLMEQDHYRIRFIYDRDAWVTADAFKMEQVLYNLINNAIHYTGEDKTVVVCQILKDEKVRIEIKDSGAGIAKEELPHIWERYYKIDKDHKRAVAGSGLGLSIVKHILELHQAAYGAESEIGHGSTFWFELKEEDPENEGS